MERIVLTAALFLWTCGEDETAVPTAAGAPAEVELIEPAHGGTVVAAGEHQVEVVAQEDGVVQAYMVGANAPPPGRTRLTVNVPGHDHRTHPVLLTYSPSEHRYVGRLRRVRVAPGPVEVVVVHGGHRYHGHSPAAIIVAPAPVVVVDRPGPAVIVADPHPSVVIVGGKFRGKHRHHPGLHLGHGHGRGHIRGHGHGGHIRIRH